MKRLNKKGFTLVELLATIVILAVLMLVGAQAIGAVMRSSRANSLLSSLDTAVKQAQTSYAQDELNYLKYDDTNKLSGTWDTLTDVLDYDSEQYSVNAGYYNKGGKEFIIAKVTAVEGSSFKSVRCTHGKIDTNTAISTTDASGKTVTTTNKLDQSDEYSKEGYYCSEDANGYVTIIRIKKLAD